MAARPVQKRKTYVVLDQIQKKFAVLSWGKDAIGKRHDFPVVENLDYVTFPRTDGKDEDGYAVTTVSGTFAGVGGGGYSGLFLHGVRVPVVLSIIGETKNIQPRAKVLVGGIGGGATSFLGAFYRYDAFTLTLNPKRTIEANGTGSTVDTAVAHLGTCRARRILRREDRAQLADRRQPPVAVARESAGDRRAVGALAVVQLRQELDERRPVGAGGASRNFDNRSAR